MMAAGATTAAGMAGELVTGLIFGNFNPNYSKEDRRRMRYIQLKYAQAYCSSESGDPNTIISDIDPNSKLKMTADGFKPANPFPDERAFEEALHVNLHPSSGHQGKFCASHAMVCLGAIVEYQIQRKNRLWVPGVSSSGKPNDYIHMFLEEMKHWMCTQLSLDQVAASELRKRHVYIAKLKNDRYFWCFPPEEVNDAKIHSLIDLVHARVVDALAITEREEDNKSMAQLFKELNDHSTNAFEFGKRFLAYLLFVSKPAPQDLVSSMMGRSVEAGRLHRILEKATAPVMRLYAQGSGQQQARSSLETESAVGRIVGGRDAGVPRGPFKVLAVDYQPSTFSINTVYSVSLRDDAGSGTDGTEWTMSKSYADFAALNAAIVDDYDTNEVALVPLPAKFGKIQVVSVADQVARCQALHAFLQSALVGAATDCSLGSATRDALAAFVDVKTLPEPTQSLSVLAETIPNHFVDMKLSFASHIGGNSGSSEICGSAGGSAGAGSGSYNLTAELDVCRDSWGHEGVFAVLNAYSQLQRMATVLGWTLEINHFFVSMFGNTLAFSRLPIRELLLTQKDVMISFQRSARGLHEYACKLNAKKNYKWHSNLQASESSLQRCRHHIDEAVATISRLESDHLDREAQIRRLRDVAARFEPFMRRIDDCLPRIQQELGLPVHMMNPDISAGGRVGAGAGVDFIDGELRLAGSGGGSMAPPPTTTTLQLQLQHGDSTTGDSMPSPPRLPDAVLNDHRFEMIDDDDQGDDGGDEKGVVVGTIKAEEKGAAEVSGGARPSLRLNQRTEVEIVDNASNRQRSEIMTVEKLQSIMKANQLGEYQLVDVREEGELEMAKLKTDCVINLPLSLAGQWTQQIQRGDLLDPEKPVLCMCHHGVRSMKMANFLIQNDFETVYNIDGGIAAYATEVDPSVGFY